MSEGNPGIDCEAQTQSLLVFTGDTSPHHMWNKVLMVLLWILKFKSQAESSCAGIDDTNAEDDEERSELIVVVDDSSSTFNGSFKIADQLLSKVTSQALCEDSHHGIELLSQSKISETASGNVSPIPESNQDKLQRSQTQKITQIMKEKDLQSFRSFGGIDGVVKALRYDKVKGLDNEDGNSQRKMKKSCQNQLPKSCFISILIDTCKSYAIILSLVVALLSLGFGLKEEGLETGWVDGAIMCLTITMLVLFTSSGRYYIEIKLLKKSRKQGVLEKKVYVTRGECKHINLSDLVRGDIVSLERGYEVPCDGFFIDGKSLEVDSGSMIDDTNPFLFYGSRVINGSGRMIVANVGASTVLKEMMATNSGDKQCKIEAHLENLTKGIHITGLLITIFIFTAYFLRFVLKKLDNENGYQSDVKGEPSAIRVICDTIRNIITEPKGTARTLISLLSVSLIGIMDGLPMVVSLAISIWNNKVLGEKATGHNLLACVKSSSITRICTDNIGRLTSQQMAVNIVSVDCNDVSDSSNLSPKVLEALCEGSCTSVLTSPDACNAMEVSLCFWANDAIGLTSNNLKKNWELLRCTESDACKNLCGVLMRKTEEDVMCLHWKGPVKEILDKCLRYYDKDGQLHDMSDQKRTAFKKFNSDMLEKQLETVALACRPTLVRELEKNDLNLVGLIGLKDSSKETTKKAIESAWNDGGVKTILVSADDVSFLEPIALQHGLLNLTSDLVLKGEDFQKLTETERMEKIDQIRVLGNCLPADKQLFVKCLKESGEVVAMVGMQTNDGPALKESDVGVIMGNWNSAVARESSDMTISNGGLDFFFEVISSGRCLYGKLQKFMQLQLIMTASSLLINFIGVIFTEYAPKTTIQLFGLNLIMTIIDGMAMLIWTSGRHISELTVRPTDPLITMAMTRNIVAQSSYQIIILMTLQNKLHLIEGLTEKSIQSMIFNSLIMCQVFNLFNARELEKKNFFQGILHDFWFQCAIAIYLLLHISFVAIGYRLAIVTHLDYRLWAGCCLIGIVSWLVDWIWKFVLPSARLNCFTDWLINCAGKCKLSYSRIGG